jgi:hypothetical protein
MDYKRNRLYFEPIQERDLNMGFFPLKDELDTEKPEPDKPIGAGPIISVIVGIIFLLGGATVSTIIGIIFIVLGIGLIIKIKIKNRDKNETFKLEQDNIRKANDKIKDENKKILEKNNEIKEENRLWNANRDIVTDADIDKACRDHLISFKERALKKLNINQDMKVEPIQIDGYYYEKLKTSELLQKKGDDKKARSSNYQVSMFLFLAHQIIHYVYRFSLLMDEIQEETAELYYDHIVSFETKSDTVTFDTHSSNQISFNVTSTSGASINAKLKDTGCIEQTIKEFKELIRCKKRPTNINQEMR